MRECWINVYNDGFGVQYPNRNSAEEGKSKYRPLLYRIHVRMK